VDETVEESTQQVIAQLKKLGYLNM